MSPSKAVTDAVWNLPPLILHPFSENVPPATLLENSRANLMLSGLVANDGTDSDILMQRLVSGRYAETRMLFFLGKDLLRWIGQCSEFVARIPELEHTKIRPQSFAELLVANPPETVKEKLTRWGVVDYASVFSRALGLNMLFVQPPEVGVLAPEFLLNYHRYADAFFRCFMESEPHRRLDGNTFQFALYASGEYSRLLESEWEKSEGENSAG